MGLLAGEDFQPRLPLEQVIARELEFYGSHGMQAARYEDMLAMICAGRLDPKAIVGQTIGLDQAPQALQQMGQFSQTGITIISLDASPLEPL